MAKIQVSGIAVFTSKWSEQKGRLATGRLFLDIFVVKSLGSSALSLFVGNHFHDCYHLLLVKF